MKNLKKYSYKYCLVIAYAVFAILIELLGSLLTDGKFYIKDPRYFLTFLGIMVSILVLIRNQKTRVYVSAILLIVQGVVNVLFIVLFEMAGQWFDYSMFSLRNDAMGILESIPINFWFFFFLMVGLSAFIVFGLRIAKHLRAEKETNKTKLVKNFTASFLIVLFLGLNFLTASSIHGKDVDVYMDLLKSEDTSKYNQYGILSNFINELYGGTVFYNNAQLSNETILSFLYDEESVTPDYFGVSEGNNVITILGETFEWFSFISDSEKFPNGLALTDAETAALFPNLTRLYDESYVLNNYHAREKTDISENYSIVGAYPINSYINYDYYDNALPQTMPNMMRNTYGEDFQANYFHDGYATFYNRNKSIIGLGFDECYTTENMVEFGMRDYGAEGVRNLDSEMVEYCKDLMFPNDGSSFYTYITTITTHGMYSDRKNLQDKYEIMYQYGMDINTTDKKEKIFYSYIAAALETDKMMGVIFDDLENKGLLENTTIVVFGDHQGYYQGLSNYVKNINSPKQCLEDDINYMDLYRVPCMIYDQKLVSAVEDSGAERISNKFSSSCDIVPTLLGLLGINYYSNFYYGHSVFTEETSLVYSRGYGYFLDEYSYFYNINNFSYINPIITSLVDENNNKKYATVKDYKNYLERKGEILIEKIRYVDQSFKGKTFNDTNNYLEYYTRINELND